MVHHTNTPARFEYMLQPVDITKIVVVGAELHSGIAPQPGSQGVDSNMTAVVALDYTAIGGP